MSRINYVYCEKCGKEGKRGEFKERPETREGAMGGYYVAHYCPDHDKVEVKKVEVKKVEPKDSDSIEQ